MGSRTHARARLRLHAHVLARPRPRSYAILSGCPIVMPSRSTKSSVGHHVRVAVFRIARVDAHRQQIGPQVGPGHQAHKLAVVEVDLFRASIVLTIGVLPLGREFSAISEDRGPS